MARTSSKVGVVDSIGNEASSDILAGYQVGNKEDAGPGATSYYGYIDTVGNWYVQRVTDTDIDFARGSNNYATNWTNRASLSYAKFDSTF